VTESLKNRIIWNEFRQGNKEALQIIYEDNYSSIYHYGLKFTKDKGLIKDHIHELFMELIDSGLRLSQTDNIRFYLLKAMRYKLLKQLSGHSKQNSHLDESVEFDMIDSIESQMIVKEVEDQVRQQVVAAIKKLSAKQQEIIYLKFYRELSYQEIALMFEVNIQTVRNLMQRAIHSLKDDLEKKNVSKQLLLLVFNLPVY
jgi:RNA polymerase sigma factor (sigma-70 family)